MAPATTSAHDQPQLAPQHRPSPSPTLSRDVADDEGLALLHAVRYAGTLLLTDTLLNGSCCTGMFQDLCIAWH